MQVPGPGLLMSDVIANSGSGLSAGYDHDAGSVECSAKGLTELDLLTAAREGDARAGARQTGRPYLLRSCRQAITLTSTLKPNQIA